MKNELTVQETRELLLNPAYQAQKTFEMQQRMAQMYVQSTIVPQAYRGNIGNCVIAIDMAQRMHANPLMVMQNLYIVYGSPAWSSKFLISCINMSGRFTPLRYQFKGDKGTPEYGCRAFAYEKNDREHKEPLRSVWITMEMANREGWTKKDGSKWLTMPDQMLIYRAAAFWSRAYAPEISMGFLTKEEVEDIAGEEQIPMPVEVINVPQPTNSERKETTQAEAVTAKEVTQAAVKKSIRRSAYRAPEETTEEVEDTETGELFSVTK